MKVSVGVTKESALIFLGHLYGAKTNVADQTLPTLVELYQVANQFYEFNLSRQAKERLVEVVTSLEIAGIEGLSELYCLLTASNMEDLMSLVEEKVKEEHLAGLLVIVNDDGPKAKVICLRQSQSGRYHL